MNKCRNCGTEFEGKFCPKCATPVVSQPENAAPNNEQFKICPVCRQPYKGKFCPRGCGLTNGAIAKKKGLKGWQITLIVIGTVFVVFILFGIIISSTTDEDTLGNVSSGYSVGNTVSNQSISPVSSETEEERNARLEQERKAQEEFEKQQQKEKEEKQKKAKDDFIAIVDAYDSNQVAADQIYKDKEITVTAIISDIGTDIFDTTYVILSKDGSKYSSDMRCEFSSESEINKIIQLKKGDTVSISGRCDGKIIDVHLEGCKIVEW